MTPLFLAQAAPPAQDPLSTLFNLGGMAAFAFSCFWLLRDQLKVGREQTETVTKACNAEIGAARGAYIQELRDERASCAQARKEDREEHARVHTEVIAKLDAIAYRLEHMEPKGKEIL